MIKDPVLIRSMEVLEWLSYPSADYIIGLSAGIQKGIERRGVKENKIRMIPNGCDLELFNPNGGAPSTLAESDHSNYLAVFAGAHGLANGLDQLLDVAAELKKFGRADIGFLFVGEGSSKEQLVREAKVRELDNCTFLDPVSKTELAKNFSRSRYWFDGVS